MSTVKYNGYQFSTYSHVTVNASMQYDDAERTVTFHRYTVRVETTIVAEAGDVAVGHHFRRIRQLLSKAGGALIIDHAGFGPKLELNYLTGGPRDVNFGPKPRILTWSPVGNTNAVEVTWECEFCIPTCEGLGGVRFEGVSALNFGISYHIDPMGYTTRTVSGYLEIAMTRENNNTYRIPDTADAYRDKIIIAKPDNFHRETTWNLSPDKRRADFTIVDSEIQSPNAYPAGVVRIRANHHVGWSRRAMSHLPQTIHAQIVLAPNQPRGRAWEIFRAIVAARIGIALRYGKVFLDGLEIDESLYDHSTSFAVSYRQYFPEGEPLSEILSGTGLFTPLATDWSDNAGSLENLQSHRGIAQLGHNPLDDQIVDLCTDTILPGSPPAYVQAPYVPSTFTRFCNEKPPPLYSWVRFEATFETVEENPATEQITMGEDDLVPGYLNLADPTASLGETDQAKKIQRYIEAQPAGLRYVYRGYAERVGYKISPPRRIKFGNVQLVRKGRGVFRHKFLGMHFCQPLYGAAWHLEYVVAARTKDVPGTEVDPVNDPDGK